MFLCHMSLKDGLPLLFLVWASGGRDGAEGLPRVVAAWDPPRVGVFGAGGQGWVWPGTESMVPLADVSCLTGDLAGGVNVGHSHHRPIPEAHYSLPKV